MANLKSTPKHTCWICGEEVSLETCKTDDRGRIVREVCYELRLRLAAEPDPALDRIRHNLSVAKGRSWKDVAMDVVGEKDQRRFQELVQELDQALAARNLARNGHDPQPNISQRMAYEKIVDDAVSIMRSDYASLQMFFPERGTGGELRLLAFRGFNPEAARFWEWVRADSKSTCGIALRDTKRVVAADIAASGFMADSEDRQVYLQTGIHACQTTPLIARGGNLVGMVSTHWRTPHQPSEGDFQAFDILAGQAADLIEHCKPGATLA